MAQIGQDIKQVIALLRAGDCVAIPTETVYGLAANALNDDAVLKIFEAKKRPKFDPLIVHTHSLEAVADFVQEIPADLYRLAAHFWPGPLTLLLPKKTRISDLVTSGLERVAIRIPRHPLSLRLLQALEFPLAAPSANPFGYISPTTAQHVADQLGDVIPYILEGDAAEVGLESTIAGMEGDEVVIYRSGGLPIREIEQLLDKKVKIMHHSSSDPKAPGMLKSHYAPTRPFLIGDIDTLLRKHRDKKLGVLSFDRAYVATNVTNLILSKSANMNEAAKHLFAYLRALDKEQPDIIIAEYVPDEGLGIAINDRLKRAAAQ